MTRLPQEMCRNLEPVFALDAQQAGGVRLACWPGYSQAIGCWPGAPGYWSGVPGGTGGLY